MRRCLSLATLFAPLALAAQLAVAEGVPPARDQQQRLAGLYKQADRFQAAGDPVRVYSTLREALRLEQLWSNNTLGEDSEAMTRLNRFTTAVLRREDGSLMRVLHSRQVSAGDKLALIRALEEDVLAQQAGQEE